MNLDKKVVKLVFAAMFSTLVCVATMVIRIPIAGTSGYVNIGDSIILLVSWLLGGFYSALAAGIGAALADLLTGSSVYAPGTFFIKLIMAWLSFNIIKITGRLRFKFLLRYLLSALAAETVMVAGYLIYEGLFLRYGAAAFVSLPSNVGQGIVCMLIGVLAIRLLDRGGLTKRFRRMINSGQE